MQAAFCFRTIVNMPSHFVKFRATQWSPGVIIAAQDAGIGAIIDDLLLIWVTTDAEEWIDQIGYLPLP